MVVIIKGLGYGDEGKGTFTEALVGTGTVVRDNGGVNAGHNVVTEDGRHHCFSQFGSGSFQGARTHLSRFMLVDPLAMIPEARHLQALGVGDIWQRVTIERDALLVTQYHLAANRLRELARAERHGSCGMGIGEATQTSLEHPENAPRIADIEDPAVLRRKLAALQELKRAELPDIGRDGDPVVRQARVLLDEKPDLVVERYAGFSSAVRIVGAEYLKEVLRSPVVFEGAQGVLLDQTYGFHPHTTWSDTTFDNADRLLAEAGYSGEVLRVGVTRTYATRHGAGPFVTHDPEMQIPGEHNTLGLWQGEFRAGALDMVMLRYARSVVGRLDALAVSHLDTPAPPVCMAYDVHEDDRVLFNEDCTEIRFDGPPTLEHQERIGRALQRARPRAGGVAVTPLAALQEIAPVRFVSWGPRLSDKAELVRELLR